MIKREDILSMEFLKKSEYTGSRNGMRYRVEKAELEGDVVLKTTIWPEPFNYSTTAEDKKEFKYFDFHEDGIQDAIMWMNNKLFEEKDRWA